LAFAARPGHWIPVPEMATHHIADDALEAHSMGSVDAAATAVGAER